ncbi:MAG: UDP-2,3-diacylglucosamine diphosphatase [Crocinitomicaceae bacterium]|nr:UDP-2,3-diacylglucosamine diphosphatase [Crocinitomicaceae bacterium]
MKSFTRSTPDLKKGKKIYFASDFHLGVPSYDESLIREKKVVAWLEECRKDAEEIFLAGDIFDFWFEYKRVVPRGFTRLLGKISEITDSGIPVHVFTGNHDMWIFDYLPSECGISLYRVPVEREWGGKKFFIGHGDGLGPGDHGYKFLKKIFANKACQWLFARLHPNFGIAVANRSSGYSRSVTGDSDRNFLGEEKEWLVSYCRMMLAKKHFDYFVFGHRHLPLDIDLGQGARYINLGDWIHYFTYAEFDGTELQLKKFEK